MGLRVPQVPQVPTGSAGADGSDGADGAIGPIGPIGPQGPAGVDGNTIDISALTANTAIADADLLLLDDGANGTNRKITFTEVKEWIRGEGVLVGRDGGVNELRIRDSRDDGALTPDDWGNRQVSFDFTDQYSSLLPSAYWASVITLKGWSDSYRVAQLMTSATSEGTNQGNKDTEPLYFRSGEDAGWGVMREVLTFPIGASGSTPNADGAANQILQTNGAGVLSWVDLPAGPITGQYQKFVLDASITGIANGATTQLSFGPFGGAGSSLLYEQYTPAAITDFGFDPINPDHLVINTDGLYQFTFAGFLAGITGGALIDYRLTISSTPALTGDILSLRNRTSTIDRHSGSGASTVYLTAGSQVFFSVLVNGRTYEVGGLVAGPETRTFVDVRRVE